MRVHLVEVHVKPGCVDAFIAATVANAEGSIREPGVARFDFFQDHGDPTSFRLIEVFRDDDGPAAHKETDHYNAWRDTVADMMAAPRKATRLLNVHPPDASFENPE
jgi:(4S)-4-hydroxy-5-phosphonooxypentane-2,3-dione isomerase